MSSADAFYFLPQQQQQQQQQHQQQQPATSIHDNNNNNGSAFGCIPSTSTCDQTASSENITPLSAERPTPPSGPLRSSSSRMTTSEYDESHERRGPMNTAGGDATTAEGNNNNNNNNNMHFGEDRGDDDAGYAVGGPRDDALQSTPLQEPPMKQVHHDPATMNLLGTTAAQQQRPHMNGLGNSHNNNKKKMTMTMSTTADTAAGAGSAAVGVDGSSGGGQHRGGARAVSRTRKVALDRYNRRSGAALLTAVTSAAAMRRARKLRKTLQRCVSGEHADAADNDDDDEEEEGADKDSDGEATVEEAHGHSHASRDHAVTAATGGDATTTTTTAGDESNEESATITTAANGVAAAAAAAVVREGEVNEDASAKNSSGVHHHNHSHSHSHHHRHSSNPFVRHHRPNGSISSDSDTATGNEEMTVVSSYGHQTQQVFRPHGSGAVVSGSGSGVIASRSSAGMGPGAVGGPNNMSFTNSNNSNNNNNNATAAATTATTATTTTTTATTATSSVLGHHHHHHHHRTASVDVPLLFDRSRDAPLAISLTESRVAKAGISRLITLLCEKNEGEPVPSSDFHSHCMPPMSVKMYMERLERYCNCSGEALLCGAVLLLRYTVFSEHPITIFNAHRLLITSIVLGIKMRDDSYFNNCYYAKIGGISVREMNKLETIFLVKLNWELTVHPEEYLGLRTIIGKLTEQVQEKEGLLARFAAQHPEEVAAFQLPPPPTQNKNAGKAAGPEPPALSPEEQYKAKVEGAYWQHYWSSAVVPWLEELKRRTLHHVEKQRAREERAWQAEEHKWNDYRRRDAEEEEERRRLSASGGGSSRWMSPASVETGNAQFPDMSGANNNSNSAGERKSSAAEPYVPSSSSRSHSATLIGGGNGTTATAPTTTTTTTRYANFVRYNADGVAPGPTPLNAAAFGAGAGAAEGRRRGGVPGVRSPSYANNEAHIFGGPTAATHNSRATTTTTAAAPSVVLSSSSSAAAAGGGGGGSNLNINAQPYCYVSRRKQQQQQQQQQQQRQPLSPTDVKGGGDRNNFAPGGTSLGARKAAYHHSTAAVGGGGIGRWGGHHHQPLQMMPPHVPSQYDATHRSTTRTTTAPTTTTTTTTSSSSDFAANTISSFNTTSMGSNGAPHIRFTNWRSSSSLDVLQQQQQQPPHASSFDYNPNVSIVKKKDDDDASSCPPVGKKRPKPASFKDQL